MQVSKAADHARHEASENRTLVGKQLVADSHKTGRLREIGHAAPPDFVGLAQEMGRVWLYPVLGKFLTRWKTTLSILSQAVTHSNTPRITPTDPCFCF